MTPTANDPLAAIPEPTEADNTDLEKSYKCSNLLEDPGGEVARSLIRLLAADRRTLTRIRDILRPVVVGDVECPDCRFKASLNMLACRCNGTGRIPADTLTVVDMVERVVAMLKEKQ